MKMNNEGSLRNSLKRSIMLERSVNVCDMVAKIA